MKIKVFIHKERKFSQHEKKVFQ